MFVVGLILRDHLQNKKDWRETDVFQEKPSRAAFPLDIRLVREHIRVLSQFHKITAQWGLINRNTNPEQEMACVQLLSNFILQYDLILMHNSASEEINYLCNLGHFQTRYWVLIVDGTLRDCEPNRLKKRPKPWRVEHLSWTGKSHHYGWIEWESENKMEPEGEETKKNASCKHRLRMIYSQG